MAHIARCTRASVPDERLSSISRVSSPMSATRRTMANSWKSCRRIFPKRWTGPVREITDVKTVIGCCAGKDRPVGMVRRRLSGGLGGVDRRRISPPTGDRGNGYSSAP